MNEHELNLTAPIHVLYFFTFVLQSASDNGAKTASTHEQFSVALGEEAVSVLAGIAFKLLKCIRADDVEICTDSRDQYTPSNPDNFRHLSMSVLKCCSSLMVRIFDSSISINPSTVPLVIPAACIQFFFESGHLILNHF